MAINTYPEVVTKMHFKCTGNVLVARWVIALVTIPLLDFRMIHRIQRNIGFTTYFNKKDLFNLPKIDCLLEINIYLCQQRDGIFSFICKICEQLKKYLSFNHLIL